MQYRPKDDAGWSGGMSKALYTNTKRVWLRIVKEGNKIRGYYKNEFDLVYQKLETYEVEFTRDWFYVGIAATSHITSSLATLEVSHFAISDEVFTLPARDIGNTGREIVATKVNSDVWSIEGAGYDIGVSSESCRTALCVQIKTSISAFLQRVLLIALLSTTTSKVERTSLRLSILTSCINITFTAREVLCSVLLTMLIPLT
jgi:hypothetical protein